MKGHTIHILPGGFMLAKFNLFLAEHRLLTYLATLVRPSDDEFKEYIIAVTEYCAFMGLRPSGQYDEIPKVCAALAEKEVDIYAPDDPKFEKLVCTHWLTKYHHYPQEGRIGVSAAPLIKEYLMQWYNVIFLPDLKEDGLNGVKAFSSIYSFRFYEMLKPTLLAGRKTREIPAHALRWLLDLDTQYTSYGSLKWSVILPAQQELLEKSDIAFEFTEIKEGRRVDRLRFDLRWKRPGRMKKAVKKKQPAQTAAPAQEPPGEPQAGLEG